MSERACSASRGSHSFRAAWLAPLTASLFVSSYANSPVQPAVSRAASSAHLTLPDAPEKRLIEKHCLACHDVSRVEGAGGTRSGWTKRIQRMIRRGSTLPPQEVPVLATYLSRALPERLRPAAEESQQPPP